MRPKVRPYVKSITHVEGCFKRNCGPACVRVVDGFEYHIKQMLPTGRLFEERKKSPVQGRAATQKYADERAMQVMLQAVLPAAVVKVEVPDLDGFWERVRADSLTNNKPSTVYGKDWVFRLHLRPFFGRMKLDAIGPAEIEKFKAAKLAEGQSKKSINNMLTVLRRVLNLAVEWDLLGRAPKVRAFKVNASFFTADTFLTFEETERFLRAAAPEWKVFVTTGVKTGLRVGELLALKWEDVDLVAGRVIIRRTLWRNQEGPPKGGHAREVPLSPDAVTALKGHRAIGRAYVFCTPEGERLTHSRVKDVVPDTCRRAGLAKRITNHGMRHTFASHLIMRGVVLKTVQEYLGHESVKMTERYSHLSPDVRREAVRLLDLPAAGDIRETGAR